jgi:hypothetical protein
MKLITTLATLLIFLSTANARLINVASNIQADSDLSADDTYFIVDKDLGRAAIKISFSSDDFDDSESYDEQIFVVQGLYFDKHIGKRGSVVYKSNSKVTICAEAKRTLGIFPRLKETGNCKIQLDQRTNTIDNGWEVNEEKVYSLQMNIDESKAL